MGQVLLFNVVALAFLILAFVLLFEDRAAAAAVSATVAIALLIMCYMPVIDSFEIFGLKAKLRQQVNEADKVLDSLREYATVSSKILYDQLKWSRIMAAPTIQETVNWYESLNKSLGELNVDERQLYKNQQPFLDYLSWQLFNIFDRVAIERTQELVKELRVQMAATNDTTLGYRIDELLASINSGARHFDDPLIGNLSVKIDRRLAELKLPSDDIQRLRNFASDLIQRSNRLQSTRQVDALSGLLLDEYEMDHQRWRRDYSQIFGSDAS
jgi:hypothetical protein